MSKFLALFIRVVIAIFTVVLQFLLWGLFLFVLKDYTQILYAVIYFLSIASVLYIILKDTYTEIKLPWIIFFFVFPVFGFVFYLIFSGHRVSKKKKLVYKKISSVYYNAIGKISERHSEMFEDDISALRQSEYIAKASYAPAHINTQVKYFPLGENKFKSMVEELEKAEKFIFLEYFIIEPGEFWDTIEEILIRKSSQGIDVRLLYDDFGCLFTIGPDFILRLRKANIKCYVFNKFSHLFNSNFNNRDHRKICVIDGNVAFTGGINLADEYINKKNRYGHWKDTAIMLKGHAVYSLTTMFLSMWSSVTEVVEDFKDFAPTISYETDGIIQPFEDSPLDNESVGETVYMNILNKAENYVYITTPYLIISREMMVSLVTAAKSGVDVRIIMPGIPDKKIIFFLSRSYYETLIKGGVRIYEYTPGFMHAKMFVSDDKTAVVGTINLDYRSLALHYECGAWLYKSSIIKNIKDDFLETESLCKEIKLEDTINTNKLGIFKLLFLGILRTFSPLL